MLVAGAGAASANVGAPTSGGQLAGEPAGIRDVAILREDLVIDLRPLADDGEVEVVATYHLDNPAAETALDLVFASGSGDPGGFRVTLDGRAISTIERKRIELPASWRAPGFTPWAGRDIDYPLRDPGIPIGFQLALASGRHELSISYSADALRHHVREPTLLRQFAYVLSPARTWAGFGGLDVTVRLPAGWDAWVSPALARDHDTLHAVFPAVPADAIALSVRAPTGAYGPLRTAAWTAFAIVALGGGVAVFAWAAVRGRRRFAAGKLPSTLGELGIGVAWVALFLATGLGASFGPAWLLPPNQVDHRGYGEGIGAFLIALGALPVLVLGVWLARAAGRLAYRREARRTANRAAE